MVPMASLWRVRGSSGPRGLTFRPRGTEFWHELTHPRPRDSLAFRAGRSLAIDSSMGLFRLLFPVAVLCAACASSSPSAIPGDAATDAPPGDAPSTGVCPNVYDVGNPDAGGVCCCRTDIHGEPLCDADGGSPTCPANLFLYHDLECSAAGGPCSLPRDP
jgi:hypothetical protein